MAKDSKFDHLVEEIRFILENNRYPDDQVYEIERILPKRWRPAVGDTVKLKYHSTTHVVALFLDGIYYLKRTPGSVGTGPYPYELENNGDTLNDRWGVPAKEIKMLPGFTLDKLEKP